MPIKYEMIIYWSKEDQAFVSIMQTPEYEVKHFLASFLRNRFILTQ